MNDGLKLILWWLAVVAGVVLVLIAPFNLKGAGLAALGAGLLVYGLLPILRKRKRDREQGKGGQQ